MYLIGLHYRRVIDKLNLINHQTAIMPKVRFTSNLKRFYPDLATMEVDSKTVAEVLNKVNENHAGLKDYIVDETGALRKHVHIFIGDEMVKDRTELKDKLTDADEVYIMQALSGG